MGDVRVIVHPVVQELVLVHQLLVDAPVAQELVLMVVPVDVLELVPEAVVVDALHHVEAVAHQVVPHLVEVVVLEIATVVALHLAAADVHQVVQVPVRLHVPKPVLQGVLRTVVQAVHLIHVLVRVQEAVMEHVQVLAVMVAEVRVLQVAALATTPVTEDVLGGAIRLVLDHALAG